VLHACKPRRTADHSPTVYGQRSEICDNRNAQRVFVGKFELNYKSKEYKKQQLPNETLKGEDPPALEWRQVVRCCEHGDEPALAVKRGEFLE